MIVKKQVKRVEESEEEDDPDVLANIKRLERGRQGFGPVELGKLKYNDNIDDIKSIPVPFNPKLDNKRALSDEEKTTAS